MTAFNRFAGFRCFISSYRIAHQVECAQLNLIKLEVAKLLIISYMLLVTFLYQAFLSPKHRIGWRVKVAPAESGRNSNRLQVENVLASKRENISRSPRKQRKQRTWVWSISGLMLGRVAQDS